MADDASLNSDWRLAKPVHLLREKKQLLVRVAGRQIALFDTASGIRACDNRCPHEGYPLSEGSQSGECTLTCNWHNWKFNLESGENLYGGDRLRAYPVDVRGEDIWVDIADPPFAEQYRTIINSLREAFEDHSYDRIAREIARLIRIGAEPLDAMRLCIAWSWDRMEYGWTHAYAGMADWITLYHEYDGDREAQLACLVEAVAHTAFDVLREKSFPYAERTTDFNETDFLRAIEAEDEQAACALVRGALRTGDAWRTLEPALSRAALAHYNDFGHSLIYVTKAGQLIEQLGESVAEPLLLSLVRGIVFASREDQIPEFRAYTGALARWGQADTASGNDRPRADLWHKKGVEAALDTVVACSDTDPESLYRALLLANAVNLLSFDSDQQDRVRISVSGNVGWLSFTHGLTFANAVRKQCRKFPDLWPQGLLQMACFSGRHAAFINDEADGDWLPDNPENPFPSLLREVLDHGQAEYIVSVHWVKTTLAVREEYAELPDTEGQLLFAALNRFIHARHKRRQVLRTAHQSISFVDKG